MRALIAMLGLALGCESGGATTAPSSGSRSAKPAAGSAKGFGADLLRELEATGSGSGSAAAKPAAGSADTKIATGSAAKPVETKPVETKPVADPKAGSGSAAVKVAAGSADAKAGSAAKVAPASGALSAEPKAGSGSAAVKVAAAGSAKPPAGDGSAKVAVEVAKPPVAVPAELKEIKLALLPNWERDVDEPGTISLAVKVPGRPQPAMFRFRYGFEDAKAPTDRDAYKKWLADNKVFVPRQDRQAGAAWFIEGTDGSGAPAFRIVVNYGGRKLICGGSLYKDGESNKLGDLRDQTIIQAKQICESVAL